jgi:hypothetical protein
MARAMNDMKDDAICRDAITHLPWLATMACPMNCQSGRQVLNRISALT